MKEELKISLSNLMPLSNNEKLEILKYIEKQGKEIERLNNKLKDIKSQLDYLETYSSKEDVFEDMKGRLDRINKIIGSDKE